MAKRKRSKHPYKKTGLKGVYRYGDKFRAFVFLSVVNGKRRFRTKTFDSVEDAEAWRADQRVKRKRGTLAAPSDETLAEYGRAWLTNKTGIKGRSRRAYDKMFELYVERPPDGAPNIGRVPMHRLRPEHVADLYGWMRTEGRQLRSARRSAAGLSASTVRSLHSVLRQIFDYALVNGAIEIDLAKRLKDAEVVPSKQEDDERDVKAFSSDQLDAFLSAARDEHYYAFWRLFSDTGARPGEVLALRWRDVDLKERRLRIRATLNWLPGGKWETTSPKTKKARRQVRLGTKTVAVLEAWRRAQAADRLKAGSSWGDHGFVFTASTGRPVSWRNLSNHWVRICRRAKLGTGEGNQFTSMLTPYCLRHTHATLSLAAGVSVKEVSERLGHKSVAFTMDVYQDSIPPEQQKAADYWDERYA